MQSNCPFCSHPIRVPASSTVALTEDMNAAVIATVQQRVGSQGRTSPKLGSVAPVGAGFWILIAGQAVAALICLAVPIWVWQELAALATIGKQALGTGIPTDVKAPLSDMIDYARARVLIGGTLLFCLSAAWFVSFGRARSLTAEVASQKAEIVKLWQAIEPFRDNGRGPGVG